MNVETLYIVQMKCITIGVLYTFSFKMKIYYMYRYIYINVLPVAKGLSQAYYTR